MEGASRASCPYVRSWSNVYRAVTMVGHDINMPQGQERASERGPAKDRCATIFGEEKVRRVLHRLYEIT